MAMSATDWSDRFDAAMTACEPPAQDDVEAQRALVTGACLFVANLVVVLKHVVGSAIPSDRDAVSEVVSLTTTLRAAVGDFLAAR